MAFTVLRERDQVKPAHIREIQDALTGVSGAGQAITIQSLNVGSIAGAVAGQGYFSGSVISAPTSGSGFIISQSYGTNTAAFFVDIKRNDGAAGACVGGLRWYDSVPAKIWGIESNITVGGHLEFNEGATNRMVILTGGAVGIGVTSVDANYLLQLPNDAAKKAKANAWDTYASSLRWKENVAPVADPLGKLALLRGITFTHAAGRPNAGEPGIGIAAEELETLGLPGLVTRDEAGEYSGINMTLLTPLLVEAINEQQAQIASLRAEVAALKAKAG